MRYVRTLIPTFVGMGDSSSRVFRSYRRILRLRSIASLPAMSNNSPSLWYGWPKDSRRFTTSPIALRGDSPMNSRMSIRWVVCLCLILGLVTGCAEEFVLFHSASGDPLLISRRAYTSEGCIAKVKEDAARLGVTFRHIHIRGNVAGRSLLWPLHPGYACEAAIGSEQPPMGTYPTGKGLLLKRS